MRIKCLHCWLLRRMAAYDDDGELIGVKYECPHDDNPDPEDDAACCPYFQD